jgi:hypothetical protein
MEKKDLELIETHIAADEDLRRCVEEHRHFEEMLAAFNQRSHLTPEEELEQKRLKKLKLKGRDRIEQILAKYRTTTAHAQ